MRELDISSPVLTYRYFFYDSYDSHLTIGGICLAFQAIKGICLLISSLSNISQKTKEKNRRVKASHPVPIANKEDGIIVPTIRTHHASSDESSLKVMDPLEPAYNICGGIV